MEWVLLLMGVASQYLLKRVAWPLCAVTLVVGAVVSVWQLSRVGRAVITSWRDVGLLLNIIVDLSPFFSGMALGTAGIFGCMVAYDRLADDGELTAMSAAGISALRVLMPAATLGALLGVTVGAAGVWGEPWTATRYGRDVALLGTRSFAKSLKPGTFNRVGNLASVYVTQVEDSVPGEATLRGVVVGRDLPNGPVVLTAQEVQVQAVGPGLLSISSGPGEALLPAGRFQDLNKITFESARVTVDVNSWVEDEAAPMHEWQGWDVATLWEATQHGDGSQRMNKLRFHLGRKFALAVGAMGLCVLGGVLGAQRAAAARGRGYLVCALLVVGYFGVMEFGRNLTLQGTVPAWLGVNLGNAMLAAVMVRLWRTRSSRWS